jgi:hypothetical protein
MVFFWRYHGAVGVEVGVCVDVEGVPGDRDRLRDEPEQDDPLD